MRPPRTSVSSMNSSFACLRRRAHDIPALPPPTMIVFEFIESFPFFGQKEELSDIDLEACEVILNLGFEFPNEVDFNCVASACSRADTAPETLLRYLGPVVSQNNGILRAHLNTRSA